MEILRFHKVVPFGDIPDEELTYSVIAARYQNRWVCVRLKGREDWCFPGGGRESGESIEENARREFMEETGVRDYDLYPLGIYGVDHYQRTNGIEQHERFSWGGLFAAEVHSFGTIPENFEIAERQYFERFPLNNARFPDIMPGMMRWLEDNMIL